MQKSLQALSNKGLHSKTTRLSGKIDLTTTDTEPPSFREQALPGQNFNYLL
jgi:hypothetical protein